MLHKNLLQLSPKFVPAVTRAVSPKFGVPSPWRAESCPVVEMAASPRLLTHPCRPPSAGSWRPRGIKVRLLSTASIRVQGKSALHQDVLILATQRFSPRHRVACQNLAQPRPVFGRVPSVGVKGDSSPLPLKDLAFHVSAEDLSSD